MYGENIDRKAPIQVGRRADDDRRAEFPPQKARKRIGSAHMPREQRNHKAAVLIEAEYRGILKLVPHIGGDFSDRNAARADKNQQIAATKRLLDLRSDTAIPGFREQRRDAFRELSAPLCVRKACKFPCLFSL